MRAVVYERFGGPLEVRDVPAPVPDARGVVIRVEATGLCRSDRSGWLGHDPGIRLPHVPGHELVGRIEALGSEVHRFAVGDRVTTPFVCACGRCPDCLAGDGQVCRNQTQPGFTHRGSFAEQVVVHDADVNLVAVPESMDAGAAALLGCRFATAYRGLVRRARLEAGERLAVFGCGGVGLSAVMIGVALGAEVVAVDVSGAALAAAAGLGATALVHADGLAPEDLAAQVSPVDVTVDALGRPETVEAALRALRRRGRHVQVGLLPERTPVPLDVVIAHELDLLGAHGMAARDYPALVDLVTSGRLDPARLVTRTLGLEDVPSALVADPWPPGVTLIRP